MPATTASTPSTKKTAPPPPHPQSVDASPGRSGNRAVIYAHVAPGTPDPTTRLTQQIEQCQREADAQGLVVLSVIHDVGLPATLAADRSGWKHVERLIRAEVIDVVLVASLLVITTDWDEVPSVMAIRRRHRVEFQTPTSTTLARHATLHGAPERDTAPNTASDTDSATAPSTATYAGGNGPATPKPAPDAQPGAS